MPRGMSTIRYIHLVLEIWSFTIYFSGKRRSLLHPNTAQRSFFPLQSYSRKTLRKRLALIRSEYIGNVLMPPGHPIMLLKSNEFTMAAVSVKMSIHSFHSLEPYPSSERERKFRCHLCTSSVKREIRHFHVVIVQ